MSSIGAAPRAAPLSSARAEASRRNGAKSRGPKTPEGKARSSQNALKHGLRAQKHLLLPDEDAAAFRALEAALEDELAPEGVLQTLLVRRIAAAAWRIERADRIEGELFGIEGEDPIRDWGRLGLALIRDGNSTRSFETLLRYRGGALAELWRALRTLKALQAEPEVTRRPAVPTPQLTIDANAGRTGCIEMVPDQKACEAQPPTNPIEPEGRTNPGESEPAPPANEPARQPRGPGHGGTSKPDPLPAVALAHSQRGPQPNEPADRDAEGVSPQPIPRPKTHSGVQEPRRLLRR